VAQAPGPAGPDLNREDGPIVKFGKTWPGILWAALDVAAAEAAFFSSILLRYDSFHPIPPYFSGLSYLFYVCLIAVLYLPVLWAVGTVRERAPSVQGLFKGVFVLSVSVTVLPFYFREYAFSRLVIMGFCLLSLAYGLFWRLAVQIVLETPRFAPLLRERVIAAASADRIGNLVAALGQSPRRIVVVGAAAGGVVAAAGEQENNLPPAAAKAIERGSLDQIVALAARLSADLVVLDPEGLDPRSWLSLAEKLAGIGVGMRLFTGDEIIASAEAETGAAAAPEPASALLTEPLSGFQALVKRLVDIGLSLAVLVVCAPLMLAIAVAIRLASPGPVIYSQGRVGKDGITFNVYKFRTMVADAERETGPVWSKGEDRRVIPGIGRIMRRTGLDELPQFWNVLAGRMSIVGPRPERAYFFDSYPELYRGRLAVRPGLTGLAQVSCRDTTNVDLKVRHDLYYIRNYSLGLDLEIIWQTAVMLLVQEWSAIFRPKDENRD